MSIQEDNPCISELELQIEGNWTADDFTKLTSSISGIYDAISSFVIASRYNGRYSDADKEAASIRNLNSAEVYQNLDDFRSPDERLRIGRIQMASPGTIAFLAPMLFIQPVRELIILLPAIGFVGTVDILAVIERIIKERRFDGAGVKEAIRALIKDLKQFMELMHAGKIKLPRANTP